MNTFIIAHEVPIRLGLFVAVFALMAMWEWIAPRRKQASGKAMRWTSNLTLSVINSVLVRMVFPVAAIGVAAVADERGIGLIKAAQLSLPVATLLAVPAMDFALYLQHRLFHAVPILWRLHRMHHADLDVDVTTGVRFHPVEILLSMSIKFAVILLLGPPVLGVLIFEILLNATAMFSHANVRIPAGVERVARRLAVTPDMHRIHHSVEPRETDTNFGFCLPWWDRILGTYRAEPAIGHQAMTLGIAAFRSPQDARLRRMLLQPFLSPGRAAARAEIDNRFATEEKPAISRH